MLMVVFGAGASYDSSPTYTPGMTVPISLIPGRQTDREWAGADNDFHRPPLAKDLFANRPLFVNALDEFPECKTIVLRLRAPSVLSGQISIETVLQEIEAQAETYPRGKQELVAVRCYLQRAISGCQSFWGATTRGVTNYLYLLREIERVQKGKGTVALVTFNYDSLLEGALATLGREFRTLKSYTESAELFRVFKLFGSINWAREVDIPLPANVERDPLSVARYLIKHAPELQISDRFVLSEPGLGVSNGRPLVPAIAIPVEKKAAFECPQYMIDELKAVLPQVTTIFIIGWRATEEHFLDLLRQHLKREVYACIVAGEHSEAAKILRRLHPVLPGHAPSISPEPTGFTEFLRTGRAEDLLEARMGKTIE